MKYFYFLSLTLLMALFSCFQNPSNTSNSAPSTTALNSNTNPLLDQTPEQQKSALLSESLADLSKVFNEESEDIDPTHPAGGDPHHSGPIAGVPFPKERHDKLKDLLRFLFNGCHPDLLSKFKERLEDHIAKLKEKIANGGPDHLKDQLQHAQDLLTKLEAKIADCAAGNNACSDIVKEQVAKGIEELEKHIAQLEEEKSHTTDPRKLEHIERRISDLRKKLEYLNKLCK